MDRQQRNNRVLSQYGICRTGGGGPPRQPPPRPNWLKLVRHAYRVMKSPGGTYLLRYTTGDPGAQCWSPIKQAWVPIRSEPFLVLETKMFLDEDEARIYYRQKSRGG